MPYASFYIPPTENTPASNELWNRYMVDKSNRERELSALLAAYNGDYKDIFKSLDDYSVRVNPIRFCVNSDVFRMMGMSSESNPSTILFEVIQPNSSEDFIYSGAPSFTDKKTPEQSYLDSVWNLNLKDLLLQELFTTGSIYGHVFVKLIPNGLVDPFTGSLMPRLVLLNPRNVSVFWDANDLGRVLWYRIHTSDSLTHKGTIEDHVLTSEGWVVKSFESKNGRFEKVADDQVSPIPLIFDWKNQPNPFDYYGVADFGSTVIELNKVAIFVASNIAKIIKHHAHPKTIGIGIAPGQVTATSVDSFWAVPNEKAQIFNLEMRSDLRSSRDYLNMLMAQIYAEMREVNPTKEGGDLDQVTNFAVRVQFYPALIKTSAKRVIAAPQLSSICSYLLYLGGFSPLPVKVNFPQSLPKDPNADAQALTLDRANGLSMDSYLEGRGYNAALERVRRLRDGVTASGKEETEMPDPQYPQ